MLFPERTVQVLSTPFRYCSQRSGIGLAEPTVAYRLHLVQLPAHDVKLTPEYTRSDYSYHYQSPGDRPTWRVHRAIIRSLI
jgi:hypothetical protein